MTKFQEFQQITLFAMCLFFFHTAIIFSQPIPTNYFRFPMDEPILLSGSFGELRTTHFHAGIDIKSGGVVGVKVYAIADGYVSRIRVSAAGYGNMLFVTHPNGFVSTYAHLHNFVDTIANYAEKVHYAVQQFEIDTLLLPSVFPVKKGDVIGYVGNSGSSGGPHLHFEIRDEKSEVSNNPLLFGLNVKDHKKPRLFRLSVYPIGENASVNSIKKRIDFPLGGAGTLKPYIKAAGTIGFGIIANDVMDITSNTYGLFAIKLFANDSLIYHASWDKFAFAEQRYILAHIDFKERQVRGAKIQQLFLLPGNKLNFVYKKVANNGLLTVAKNDTVKMKLIVSDANGNENVLNFSVIGADTEPANALNNLAKSDADSTLVFQYNKKNKFATKNFKLEIPDSALYQPINFEFSEIEPAPGKWARIYKVHNGYEPLQKPAKIWLTHPKLDSVQLKKLYVARITPSGFGAYVGNGIEQGFVSASIKEFGSYTLKADSLVPRITALRFSPGKVLRPGNQIAFRISDLETGIGSYNAYVNNKWVLLNFDAKTARVWYTVKKEHLVKGKNTLQIVVADKLGNIKEYNSNFMAN